MRYWLVQDDAHETGPLDLSELRQEAAEGRIGADTLLRPDGEAATVRAKEIEGLFPDSMKDSLSPDQDTREESDPAKKLDLAAKGRALKKHTQATAIEAKRQASLAKLQLTDLPRLDTAIGRKAIDCGYQPETAIDLIDDINQVDEAIEALARQAQQAAPENWKQRAVQIGKRSKELVQIQRLKKKRQSLWRQLGTAIRQDSSSIPPSDLDEELESAKRTVTRIEQLKAAAGQGASPAVTRLVVAIACILLLVAGVAAWRSVTGENKGGPIAEIVSNGETSESPNAASSRSSSKSLKPLPVPQLAADRPTNKQHKLKALATRQVSEARQEPTKWFGVYYAYPRFFGIELTLTESASLFEPDSVRRLGRTSSNPNVDLIRRNFTSAARELSGNARLFRLRNPEDRATSQPDEDMVEFAQCSVSGWSDPVLNTFSLHTVKWSEVDRPLDSRTLMVISGTESESMQQLGGWIFNQQIFVATKDPDAWDELLQRAIEAQRMRNPQRLPGARPPAAPADVETALSWMDLFSSELELEDRERWRMGDHRQKAMSLYMSGHFQAIFGKRFDDLTWDERDHWAAILKDAQRGKHGSQTAQRARQFTAINMFKSGSPGWTGTAAAVWMNRVFRSWIDERLAVNRKALTYPSQFDELQQVRLLSSGFLSNGFDSERETLSEQLATLEQRVASETLASMATGPGERDQQGNERLDLMLAAVDAAEAESCRRRFAETVRKLRVADLQIAVNELAGIADNSEALRATAHWKSRLSSQFSDLRGSDSYQAADAYLQQRRSRLLEQFNADVIAEMAAAESTQGVKEISAWSLLNESERQSKPGTAISAAADKHLQRTERLEMRHYFSPQENDWMAAESLTIRPPKTVPSPTAESIGMAFAREIGKVPGCELISPNTFRYSFPGFGKYVSFRVTIKDIQLFSAERYQPEEGEFSRSDKQYYRCQYRLDPIMSPEGSVNDMLQGSVQGKLLDVMMQGMRLESSVSSLTDVFEATSEGWRSPTLRQRGIESMFRLGR